MNTDFFSLIIAASDISCQVTAGCRLSVVSTRPVPNICVIKCKRKVQINDIFTLLRI